jgi:hypothetical protein
MVFILCFAILSFALPLTGEIWRHGSNNIVIRGKDEAAEAIASAVTTIKTQIQAKIATEIQAQLSWRVLALGLLRLVGQYLRELIKGLTR